MEPLVLAGCLSKLIGLGLAMGKSYRSAEGIDETDLKALMSGLDTVPLLSRLWKSECDTTPGALHMGLVTRAFGLALARYWRSPHAMSKETIQRCVEHAALEVLDPSASRLDATALELALDLCRTPTNNPYYKALWDAFSNPPQSPTEIEAVESPLGENIHEFERHFRNAYTEAMATGDGQRVQSWLLGLAEEVPHTLRFLLAQDLAAWGRRHVFGNLQKRKLPEGNLLPFMPLEDVYVEPSGRYEDREEPMLGLLRGLLEEHKVILVKAAFGHGKSLTARSLVRELARDWLGSMKPTTATPYPVFIKCQRDIRHQPYKHDDVVRRALWNHSKEVLDKRADLQNGMYEPVAAELPAVFVLDGLDEVVLTENQLTDLFRTLDEGLGRDQRAIVFTRPGALHERRRVREEPPVVELLQFSPEQINAWIDKWNRLDDVSHVDSAALHQAQLDQLARTPILLLMIAVTWDKHLGRGQSIDRVALYEQFMRHLAHGKYRAADPEKHEGIQQAAADLHQQLRKRSCVDSDDPVDAMLWLMGRVAWEHHTYEYERRKPLQIRHIEALIEDELEVPAETLVLIRTGLLLAMQMDPTSSNRVILFGHRSFREFLVARFWREQLRASSKESHSAERRHWLEKPLMQAALVQRKDGAFALLEEMKGQIEDQRPAIQAWAKEWLHNARLDTQDIAEDRKPLLRLNALAIAGDEHHRLQLNEWTLGFLDAALRLTCRHELLVARAVLAPNSRLRRADLRGADLREADLSNADLFEANLAEANLAGANLTGADLVEANLTSAHLTRANFTGANLTGTNLTRANLTGANLVEAHLFGANLAGAHLFGANLTGTNLAGATLFNLAGAAFLGAAQLISANLHRADLRHATFANADLTEAHL